MTVYQLYLKGKSAVFEEPFKAACQTVTKHYPTEEEKQDFIKSCQDKSYLNFLDVSTEKARELLEVKVLELTLKDQKKNITLQEKKSCRVRNNKVIIFFNEVKL